MGALDVIFARAIMARDFRAVRPKLNEGGTNSHRARQTPADRKDRVVPVDIWLGETFRTLIITGPNTGGKTVTLKTVGLFTLMAMSGMFIPADEGTELSTFDSVFADIGDEQSIEQSLSTFSSHMTNTVRILAEADGRSLVLLDELGAGTDRLKARLWRRRSWKACMNAIR
jgi:DNA mismatch repair protein MutS2